MKSMVVQIDPTGKIPKGMLSRGRRNGSLRRRAILVVTILASLAGASSSWAMTPEVSCDVIVNFWPHTAIARTPGRPPYTNQGAILYWLSLWNKQFRHHGYFIAEGDETMAEWRQKEISLPMLRAKSLATILNSMGVPRSHIRLQTGGYPWDMPGPSVGIALYCDPPRCQCPKKSG